MKQQFFRIGAVAKPHGIKGEAKVFPTSQDMDRYKDLDSVIFMSDKDSFEKRVLSVKMQPPFVIMAFEGIDSMEEILKYKGYDIMVKREDAIPLEPGQHYIADILGFKVISDEGEALGLLKDVLITGANDVYQVLNEETGEEILIPGIDQCILNIDEDKEEILVHLLKGLRD